MVVCLGSFGLTQELFSNGGFEEYLSCPTGWAQTNRIVGCVSSNDSPDYYNFNYSQLYNCYNLEFVFSMGIVNGDPLSPHYAIDAESIVGNANTEYADFSFVFTPDQNYTHVYIVTGSTNSNLASNPDPNCLSAGSLAYIYYNLIDDLSITPNSAGNEPNPTLPIIEGYPNPTDGLFTIKQQNGITNGSELVLVNTSGQVVYSIQTNFINKKMALDFNSLRPGIYNLHIKEARMIPIRVILY